ncbi:MAG: hypothetical protein RI947_716 [Candidatus Parcubacteria bacterium]|jgi:DNA-binding MarR family transcriptional regulator
MDTLSSQVALETRILLLVLNKHIKKEFERNLHKTGANISGLQYGVLRLLKHKSQTLSTLSHKMMVEAATLVPVIDALEHKGYLKRVPDRMDRRRNMLSLTDTGKEFLIHMPLMPQDDIFTSSLKTIDMGRQKELLHLLRTLLNKMTGSTSVTDEIHEVAAEEFSQTE